MTATSDSSARHVAIIPDGNRRWARSRGLAPWQGHMAGDRNIQAIVEKARALGIGWLTLWVGSYDNLTRRSKKEIAALHGLYHRYIVQLLKSSSKLTKEGVRVRILGEWRDLLPARTVKVMQELIDKTESLRRYNLTILCGYNGNREMLAAVRAISGNFAQHHDVLEITPATIAEHLWTVGLPPVDLVIRTGGEPHLSNGFMMWLCQNANVEFSDKFWPDFTARDFEKAVRKCGERERRQGA